MDSDLIEISPLNLDGPGASFGGGLELLMNDKTLSGKGGGGGGGGKSSDVDVDDLNNLERELNSLVNHDGGSGDKASSFSSSSSSMPSLSNFFGGGGGSSSKSDNMFESKENGGHDGNSSSLLGSATAENDASSSMTWDGFGKFNNIPMNPDKVVSAQSQQMSKEDLLREKFKFLRKLEILETKGVSLTKKYNMDSPLAEMQGEYEMIMEEKSKVNSVKFQGNMLMAVINGIEFLNSRFDPFDIKLDGWSEQLNENLNDYDDVFGELHEKYKSKATLAPELKLMFQLAGSAMMVHMTNTMFKSSMPGMDDILRQNPDLMRQFQTAAVNSMSQQSPNFGGFMNNMMNPDAMNAAGGSYGPPPPMATQGPNSIPPPIGRPGNNNSMGRSSSMGSNNTNMNNNNNKMGFGMFDDGVNIRDSEYNVQMQKKSSRPEMKGPSDISDILSGLKTKTVDIQRGVSQPSEISMNENSSISLSDMRDLNQSDDYPKKSKRRQKSDKNSINLDF